MKYISILLFVLISLSCSRGYYNTVNSYYNYEEAYQLVHGLKEGTLIVQIPCNRKKANIYKALYEKETDPIKKAERKHNYDKLANKLMRNQKSLMSGVKKYYHYSNYVFVPDTLIREFKQGIRENIFLKSDFTFEQSIDIDTNKTIMLLREFRDTDDLYIYKIDGSVPPEPFPYASTVPTGDLNLAPADNVDNSGENTDVYAAIYTIDARLRNFYKINKPPN